MPICPIGHDSRTDDYCEVCGRLLSAGAASTSNMFTPPPRAADYPGLQPPPPAPDADPDATAAVEMCPRCNLPREGGEPFCEECRWNFLTPPDGRQPAAPPLPSRRPLGFQRGEAEPPSPSWPGEPSHPRPAEFTPSPQSPPPYPVTSADFLIAPPSSGEQSPAPSLWQRDEPSAATPPLPARPRSGWYAVVSADREYFTAMMARSGPEARNLFFPPYCPERRYELTGRQLRIGRVRVQPSQSEDVPDIDLSRPPEDPGVSHRHAVLVRQPDGTWSVVDQDSTNGTTINLAEDPIAAHVPVPLEDGDRVHVGAWTTITIHQS